MAIVTTNSRRLNAASDAWVRHSATAGLLALISVPICTVLATSFSGATFFLEIAGYAFILAACFIKLLYSHAPRRKTETFLGLLFVATCVVIANYDLTLTGKKALFFTIAGFGIFTLLGGALSGGAMIALRVYVAATAAILATPLSGELLSIAASRQEAFSLLGDFRLQGFLVSPNTNGALLAVYLLVELAELRKTKSRVAMLAKLILATLATLQLLQTGSITAMTAAVLGIACYFVPSMPVRRLILIASLGYAFYPAAAVFLDVLNGGTRPLPFDSQFATGRGQIWFRVAELISQNPLGVPASFALPGENENSLSAYGGGHAHNLVLELWLIGGWMGLAAAVAFAFYFALMSWARVRPMVSISIFALMSFAEVPLFWLPGSANFLVMATLIAFSSSKDERIEVE